ncbi:hypothetical protein DAQ1742_01400 [Dickeya aquatica]|uniref:Uncharacterized protein n=2 Tax=Pectobacteriaceae TaxID=1903410 RepID=A0A375A8Q0_9GAMM|nr:hypothetical protein DAQ1742_01400 [Dickeya aquatica]
MMVLGSVCLVGAAQANPVVYRGTLGTAPVVVELDIGTNGKIEGRYFSPAAHVMHSLVGDLAQKGTLVLTVIDDEDGSEKEAASEDGTDNEPFVEQQLTLQPLGEQGWKGEWRDGRAAPVAAVLTPAAPLAPAVAIKLSPFMQSLYALSLYDFLFQQGNELKMVKQGRIGDYQVEWWQDPLTDSSMFQVVSGYPAEQREQLNAQLRADFWQMTQSNRCSTEDVFKVKIGLLSAGVVSYIATNLHLCPGSAHPSTDVYARTFRVSDTALLSLADLLWVGEPPIPDEHYITDNYRDDTLPVWLKKQFDRLYPVQMRNNGKVNGVFDGCNYTSADIWTYAPWYLTRNGIVFQPMMPNMMDACNHSGWEVLPWPVVNQHRGRLQDMRLP